MDGWWQAHPWLGGCLVGVVVFVVNLTWRLRRELRQTPPERQLRWLLYGAARAVRLRAMADRLAWQVQVNVLARGRPALADAGRLARANRALREARRQLRRILREAHRLGGRPELLQVLDAHLQAVERSAHRLFLDPRQGPGASLSAPPPEAAGALAEAGLQALAAALEALDAWRQELAAGRAATAQFDPVLRQSDGVFHSPFRPPPPDEAEQTETLRALRSGEQDWRRVHAALEAIHPVLLELRSGPVAGGPVAARLSAVVQQLNEAMGEADATLPERLVQAESPLREPADDDLGALPQLHQVLCALEACSTGLARRVGG